MDTAFLVLSTDGYSGMTMAKVAKMAGLPVGSVYWHFESKDILLASLIENSFENWHHKISQTNRPLPNETFAAHVQRIFLQPATKKFVAADFWRLGVILSVDQSVPEQTARTRFLHIRELQRAELTSWWRMTLEPTVLQQHPDLPAQLSAFTLAWLDGNAIAGASGETVDHLHHLLAHSLISIVEKVSNHRPPHL